MNGGDTAAILLVLISVGALLIAWVGAILRVAAESGRRVSGQVAESGHGTRGQVDAGSGAETAVRTPGRAWLRVGLTGQGERGPLGERVFWVGMVVALAAQTALIVVASLRRGTFAVYDQAEFLLAIGWFLVLLTAFFMLRRKIWGLAAVVVPLDLLLLGWVLLVPEGSGAVRPAALSSAWLLVHIVTSVVAYAAFTVTFATGLLSLLRRYAGRGPESEPVERLGYQAAVFGFPFMTMVIFSGALWAKYVWGRYWAWDPIEAWALVTWLVYAAYLHAQYSRRWQGIRSAWISVAGFVSILATYLFFTHLWS